MKTIALMILSILPMSSFATCPVAEADKVYRDFVREVSGTTSLDGIDIYRYVSKRNESVLRDAISKLLSESNSPEDVKRNPILAKPLDTRKRMAWMIVANARFIVPNDTTPDISESDGGVVLRYSWKSSREEFDEDRNIPVDVVTHHHDEISFVCESGWKIDFEEHKLRSKVFSKSGVPIEDSIFSSEVTFKSMGR